MSTDTEAPTAAEPEAEPIAETPAVVEQTAEVVHHHGPDERTALEAAADAALMMPGVPGRDEFLALAMTARILSLSAGAPKAIQNNPHLAFHVAMIGRDLGISPSASIELIDVIEKKKNGQHDGYQLSLSPQLLNGQLRRLGLGQIIPAVRTPVMCEAIPVGPRGLDQRCTRTGNIVHVDDCGCDILGPPSIFTWDDAKMAGLVGPGCEPGEHTADCKTWKAGKCCNQGYRTYPQRMMWWRAAGFCADDYFPEAGLGLYRPEELGAVVDAEGRPVDPANVELPPGYEPEPPKVDERAAAKARELEEPMSDLDLLDLQIRIQALPPEQRKLLGEKWKEHERLSKYRLESVPAALHRLAAALVTGVEAAARSATKDHDQPWDQRTARAVIVSSLQALVPQDGPDEDGGAPAPADANGEPVAPEDGAGTAPDGLPAEPEFDLDNDDQADGPSDRPSSPKDDPALPAALARMDALNPPQEMIDRLSAAVKAMHHTEVNRVITDHGGAAEGHIDTRRVLACSYLISDEMGASTDGSS